MAAEYLKGEMGYAALGKAVQATTDCPYRRTFHSNQGAYRMELYVNRARYAVT